MILHLQKMRKFEKRSDDHTSYHIRNHGLLSLLHFHKLATFFKPPGCERNLYFEAISGKDYFNLSSRFFSYKREKRLLLETYQMEGYVNTQIIILSCEK